MKVSLAALPKQVLQNLLEDDCLVEAYLTAYRDIMEIQSFRYKKSIRYKKEVS